MMPRRHLKEFDVKLCVSKSLILTVTENGFGKRTDVDEYRLTARGAQGVNNLKATPKVGKSRIDPVGQRDLGAGRHQPMGQDHPHRHQDRPRRWPRHPGRPPAQPRRRRQGSRRRHHSARRTERKRRRPGHADPISGPPMSRQQEGVRDTHPFFIAAKSDSNHSTKTPNRPSHLTVHSSKLTRASSRKLL